MENFKLIYNYKDNQKYRESFNELAKKTFEIDFEEWYQRGFWNENYVCYSYLDGDKIVSNISINYMDIIINGEKKKAIQIATVMTDKDYRNKGLAAKLMDVIINKYEKEFDFFYLSANESVLEFYPKFGFELKEETSFMLPVDVKESPKVNMRKLDISNEEDLKTIINLHDNRKPISKSLGVIYDKHILMFYCLNVFTDNIYYLEDDNIIVIYTVEGNELNLFDVISSKDVSIDEVLNKILSAEIKNVVFHFTVDLNNENIVCKIDNSNHRFIRPGTLELPERFQFPQISQT